METISIAANNSVNTTFAPTSTYIPSTLPRDEEGKPDEDARKALLNAALEEFKKSNERFQKKNLALSSITLDLQSWKEKSPLVKDFLSCFEVSLLKQLQSKNILNLVSDTTGVPPLTITTTDSFNPTYQIQWIIPYSMSVKSLKYTHQLKIQFSLNDLESSWGVTDVEKIDSSSTATTYFLQFFDKMKKDQFSSATDKAFRYILQRLNQGMVRW